MGRFGAVVDEVHGGLENELFVGSCLAGHCVQNCLHKALFISACPESVLEEALQLFGRKKLQKDTTEAERCFEKGCAVRLDEGALFLPAINYMLVELWHVF